MRLCGHSMLQRRRCPLSAAVAGQLRRVARGGECDRLQKLLRTAAPTGQHGESGQARVVWAYRLSKTYIYLTRTVVVLFLIALKIVPPLDVFAANSVYMCVHESQ